MEVLGAVLLPVRSAGGNIIVKVGHLKLLFATAAAWW